MRMISVPGAARLKARRRGYQRFAGGASNRNVASQLFLSPKTLEYHLRKVFQILGMSVRVELASLPLAPVAVGATDC